MNYEFLGTRIYVAYSLWVAITYFKINLKNSKPSANSIFFYFQKPSSGYIVRKNSNFINMWKSKKNLIIIKTNFSKEDEPTWKYFITWTKTEQELERKECWMGWRERSIYRIRCCLVSPLSSSLWIWKNLGLKIF